MANKDDYVYEGDYSVIFSDDDEDIFINDEGLPQKTPRNKKAKTRRRDNRQKKTFDVPALSISQANEVVKMCVSQMSEMLIFTSSQRGQEIIRDVESWTNDEMRCNLVNAVNRAIQSKEPASSLQQLAADFGLSFDIQNYLIHQLIKALPKLVTTAPSSCTPPRDHSITDNEKQAIFYVGGSIVASLLRDKAQDAEFIEFVNGLRVEQEDCKSVYAGWTALQSNKALKFISEPFLAFLLRCEEAIVLKIVCENGLRKNCLVRDMFVSACYDNVGVTECWNGISAGLSSSISERLLYIIITKFCNTRSKGFTRYLNQNLESASSSQSLRQSLKRK